jgi:hypothetical protein
MSSVVRANFITFRLTLLAAIQNFIPNFLPFFSPMKGSMAYQANFLWKISFFPHFRHTEIISISNLFKNLYVCILTKNQQTLWKTTTKNRHPNAPKQKEVCFFG